MTKRLTVIIPCKNEREHIRACIASAQAVADEVLVADSGSTDGTLQIAHELGCRIIEREYVTYGDFLNWAVPQATHSWVFVLDADERIPHELAEEIRDELAHPQHDGYWTGRLNYFLGHPIRRGPWKNDQCVRLFRRDLGRYDGAVNHAEASVRSGNVGELKHRLVHYTFISYAQFLPKVHRYADLQARDWYEQGRQPSYWRLLLHNPLRFLHGYIWRLGFWDGLAGLQVCALEAYQSYLKQARLWELHHAYDWRELQREAPSETEPDESTTRTAA